MQVAGDPEVFPDEVRTSLELLQLALSEGHLCCLAARTETGHEFLLAVVFIDEDGTPLTSVIGKITPQQPLSALHEPPSALHPSNAIN